MKLRREVSATEKASQIRSFYQDVVLLRDDIDKFKYNSTLPTSVGKELATALHSIEAAKIGLRNAGSEMAWEALEGEDE